MMSCGEGTQKKGTTNSAASHQIVITEDGGRDSMNFIGDKVNGWYYSFRKDGTLKVKTYYVNDTVDGEFYSYYEDGISIEKNFKMKKGKHVGESFIYSKNGGVLSYKIYDDFNVHFFTLDYDTLGNAEKALGKLVSSNLLADKYEAEYNPLDSFTLTFVVATPPNTIQKVYSGDINNGLVPLSVKNNRAEYRGKFSKMGTHKQITVGELYNMKGKLIKRDTVSTTFLIEKN